MASENDDEELETDHVPSQSLSSMSQAENMEGRNLSNLFLAYSTADSFSATRDPQNGSWYIQVITYTMIMTFQATLFCRHFAKFSMTKR